MDVLMMSQVENDLIYKYLHENFEYRNDGNLVRIKDGLGFSKAKKGDLLGSFFYQGGKNPRMRCTLNINKCDYTKNLSHLIFLFHHKYIPQVVDYYDNNPMNCRIENLIASSRKVSEAKKEVRGYIPFKSKTGKTRYRVTLQIGKELKVSFGSYETPEQAREIYEYAKSIHVSGNFTPDEIKIKVMERFPDFKMKLKITNKLGYKGIYQRGTKFVARGYTNNGHTISSTHNTPEEAHEAHLAMLKGIMPIPKRGKLSDFCTAEGCNEPWYCKNLCKKHYHRYSTRKKRKDRNNKTGFPGVKEDKGKFSARYKNTHLGTFLTVEEAHEAYISAKKKDLIFL
jgi:hypothetical protein